MPMRRWSRRQSHIILTGACEPEEFNGLVENGIENGAATAEQTQMDKPWACPLFPS